MKTMIFSEEICLDAPAMASLDELTEKLHCSTADAISTALVYASTDIHDNKNALKLLKFTAAMIALQRDFDDDDEEEEGDTDDETGTRVFIR